MGKAAFQRDPRGRIERDRVRSLAKPNTASGPVDLIHAQQPQLPAGGAVQQCEQTEQRLMWMHAGVGGPSSEQGTLVVEGDGASAEVPSASGGHVAGGSTSTILCR